MIFTDLQTIAEKYITKTSQNIPRDSFEITRNLNIRVKNSSECKEDFQDNYPLKRSNAVYALYKGEYTIYYDEKNPYKNFSVAHEVAHHILKHETDGATHHHDANLLAAIIVAPASLIKKNKIKSSKQLSENCLIPIEVAEMYWKEMYYKKPPDIKNLIGFGLSIILAILLVLSLTNHPNKLSQASTTVYIAKEQTTEITNPETQVLDKFYSTPTGIRFHKEGCRYIKNKTNLTSLSQSEAIERNLTPCKVCFKE